MMKETTMGIWFKRRAAAAVLGVTAVVLAAGQIANAEAAAPESPHRVEIQATSAGFVPDSVRLVAGAEADLVFTRTAGAACVAQVHIPELGVGLTALPEGTPVAIRVRPQEPGTYEFRCAMNMRRGTIIVARQAGP
jgi:plastocyanin domain-containing protein